MTLFLGLFVPIQLPADCSHHSENSHEKSCPKPCIIDKLPFTITTAGEYLLEKSHTVDCDRGIFVQADDVTITFCPGVKLTLTKKSTGIFIDDSCNVSIHGADFEGCHSNNVDAIAIKATYTKNLHITESKSFGISQGLIVKQCKDVTVEKVCWEADDCGLVHLISLLDTHNTHIANSTFKIHEPERSEKHRKKPCFSTESCDSEKDKKPQTARTKAIFVGDNIKNWEVTDCVFKNFDRAICTKSFSDGTVKDSQFYFCHEGIKVDRKGFVERLSCKNLRGEDTRGLSWLISLDGRVADSCIEKIQLTNTHIYCFQCNNSSINNVEIDSAVVNTEATFGIQCGGPRGPGIFSLKPEDKLGCTNCRISNIKCRMASLEPNSILFMIPIVALFCQNCEITDSQVLCDGGATRAFGVGILESYCSECTIARSSAVGPCVVGIHVCDFLDFIEFCRASVVEDCEVQDCHYGINLWRCRAGAVQNCKAKLSKIGIFVSENASSAIVENCHIVENEIGFLYQPLFRDALLPATFTPDPVLGEPVNGILLKNIFAGNTTDIVDNSQNQDLNIEPSNKFF